MVLRKIPGKGWANKMGTFSLIVLSGLVELTEQQFQKLKQIEISSIKKKIYSEINIRNSISIEQKAKIYSDYLKNQNKIWRS